MSHTQASREYVTSQVLAIVSAAGSLSDEKLTDAIDHISYCAIFAQGTEEYEELICAFDGWGVVANETPTGPVFVIDGVATKWGPLRVIKIRKPDPSRPERGDADFALRNYKEIKDSTLGSEGFSLIVREQFEMIELVEAGKDVRVYYSNPPVEEHDGIRQALSKP